MGSSQTRDQIHVSWISKRILNHWATKEALTIATLIGIGTSVFFPHNETLSLAQQTVENFVSWNILLFCLFSPLVPQGVLAEVLRVFYKVPVI